MKPALVRKLSLIFAWAGLADALYLTWIKLSHHEAICAGIGDCETVNTSIYSQVHGIPIAVLGAGTYVLILLALYLEKRSDFFAQNSMMIVFGLSLTGVLYSAYLTYIELFVLHAVCPYCVVSAVLLTAIFVLSVWRLFSEESEEEELDAP